MYCRKLLGFDKNIETIGFGAAMCPVVLVYNLGRIEGLKCKKN